MNFEQNIKKLRLESPENISSSNSSALSSSSSFTSLADQPPENFTDFNNNFSMNERNIRNYLYYINKWGSEIQDGIISEQNLNKYVNIAFAFLRDLQKDPNLRKITNENEEIKLTTNKIIDKIKNTNRLISEEQRRNLNQAKLREMDINLASGNFSGGKKRRTLKRKTNKKVKKTYKKRKVNKRRK
jgi:hypothetical protein